MRHAGRTLERSPSACSRHRRHGRAGDTVLTILTMEANVAHAREAMRKAGSKLPTPWHLVVEDAK
ncbi:MAG TPA: hypothetical protein VJ400_06220 [Thermoplasmata archaeon]|nr:hypothetical protein [Thermoplasmata archaeon]